MGRPVAGAGLEAQDAHGGSLAGPDPGTVDGAGAADVAEGGILERPGGTG
jgi:hypothetical protein